MGEFACPICNSVNNTILPYVPLSKLKMATQYFQNANNQSLNITSELKITLDVYVDFLGEIIQKQQSVIDRK